MNPSYLYHRIPFTGNMAYCDGPQHAAIGAEDPSDSCPQFILQISITSPGTPEEFRDYRSVLLEQGTDVINILHGGMTCKLNWNHSQYIPIKYVHATILHHIPWNTAGIQRLSLCVTGARHRFDQHFTWKDDLQAEL